MSGLTVPSWRSTQSSLFYFIFDSDAVWVFKQNSRANYCIPHSDNNSASSLSYNHKLIFLATMLFKVTVSAVVASLVMVQASAAALVAKSNLDVFSPRIISPNAKTVWTIGTEQFILWYELCFVST